MTTAKQRTTKSLRQIDKELESFTVPGRKKIHAAWLASELEPLMLKVLCVAGTQTPEISVIVSKAGGEGVREGAAASECDLSSPKSKNPQYEPKDYLSAATRNEQLAHMVNGGSVHAAAPATLDDVAAVYGTEAVAKALRLVEGVKATLTPDREESSSMWPIEAMVRVVGPVPNPRLIGAQLVEGGRGISLLSGGRRDWPRNLVVKCRKHSSGTEGCPIYEAVARD